VDPDTDTQKEGNAYTTTFREHSSVTGVTQMSSHTTVTSEPCPCVCLTNSFSITDAELAQRLMDIKKKLTVNKTTLSSTVRRKTSATDERISSASMGAAGICVIIVIIMSVMAGDIGLVVRFAKSLW
jgi:hypothetical protein